MAVIAGRDLTGNTNDVEVVRIYQDGSTSSSPCSIPPYPMKAANPGGVVTDNGSLIMCGGYVNSEAQDNCYRFDDETWTWEEFQSMNSKRNDGAESMTYTKGLIYVAGGSTNSRNYALNNAEKYVNGSWSAISNLPTTVYGNCLVPIPNDKLLSIGGYWPQGRQVRILNYVDITRF